MKIIKCKCSKDILLDDDCVAWFVTQSYSCNGKALQIAGVNVASLILGHAEVTLVDHVDRNSHNNQRSNLRIATRQQNNANKGPYKNGSGYKGVSFYSGKWQARIYKNKKLYRLGCFINIHDAARAYNEKARLLYGEFAYINPISENAIQ